MELSCEKHGTFSKFEEPFNQAVLCRNLIFIEQLKAGPYQI